MSKTSKMHTVMALSMRPRSLDDLIGADEFVLHLRHRFESGRIPKALLLCGQTGGGKTTAARIIAAALQCTHDKKFGSCLHCYKNRSQFDITEINAAKVRKVEDIEAATDSYIISPMPGSKYRVFILDEAHMLSDHSQNLLLKHTEECPESTIFIFNTTREDKIIRTLRRRCRTYVLPSLEFKGMQKLVKRALHKVHSDLDSMELVEKLMEKDVTSPGLILNAVESYLDGSSPEDASEVESKSEIKTKSVCRQVINGDWESVAHSLKKMTPEDVHAIQGAVSKYLLGILLNEAEAHKRGKSRSAIKSIHLLSHLSGQSDNVQMSALGAILYDVCRYFKKYSR